jgi:hypothetical protein
MVMPTRLSHVNPYFLDNKPYPPPKVSPPIPTVAHDPPGIIFPFGRMVA